MQNGIPQNATQLLTTHLAEGEVTGHYHEATGDGVTLLEADGQMYLRAPAGSVVTHQEHAPVTLPAGDYLRRIVREYDHFAEEARAVLD